MYKIRKKNGNDVVNLINKLPFQFHLPGHNYTGPGTNLLLNIEKGLKPINDVDKAALDHDIEYFEHKDLKSRHQADKKLEEKTDNIPGLEAKIVNKIMNIKQKLGLGIEDNFKKFLEDKKDKKIIVKPEIKINLKNWCFLTHVLKYNVNFNPENCSDFTYHKKINSDLYKLCQQTNIS